MGLETATYLDDLNTANPTSTDPKAEGDDHLRLLKTVLKATFPGLAGRAWRRQSKSAGYTVVATDNTTLLNCTAALTLSLTAVASLGNGFMFIVNANGGDVVLDPNSTETINGASTRTVTNGDMALVFCDGVEFWCISIARAGGYAPLASPTFTGTPAGPTAAVDTDTTQLATTAYVVAQAASANPTMNGTVAVGTSKRYARSDHVHPSDTSRAVAGAATASGLTMATSRLLGRTTASTGAIEEISVGTGLTLSGGSLSASGGVTSINGMSGAITIAGANDETGSGTARITISSASGTVTIARNPGVSSPPGGTSLHGDSLIEMADGSQKWLRDLRLGDLVRGQYGATEVLGIWQNRLGARDLCEVDSVACTAGHLFWSERGWAAVSKEAYRDTAYMNGVARALKGKRGIFLKSYSILPDEVIDLQEGMPILRADGWYRPIDTLRRIKTAEVADEPMVAPATTVFSLVLADGHYFFADGIAVGCIS